MTQTEITNLHLSTKVMRTIHETRTTRVWGAKFRGLTKEQQFDVVNLLLSDKGMSVKEAYQKVKKLEVH